MAVEVKPRASISNRRRLIVAGAIVVAALGVLVYRGLDDATVYFRTADEALEQREQLGTRRFRIEGEVVDGTIDERGREVTFVIEEGGRTVLIRHDGDPPELFQPGIPVVLEGRFAEGSEPVFLSDRIMVKHSEEYKAENPDRVSDYPEESPER